MFAKKGTLDLIIQAMKLFPKHVLLQENACVALWNLSVDGMHSLSLALSLGCTDFALHSPEKQSGHSKERRN
jgi:hypothetical protein